MPKDAHTHLSRRERQIMDVLYRLGRASAAEVLEALPDPPSYSSVRTLLRVLEDKGHLRHAKEGNRYIYIPKRPRARAAKAALKQVMQTFFQDSTEKAVAALLEVADQDLSEEELDRLAQLIEDAKRGGE